MKKFLLLLTLLVFTSAGLVQEVVSPYSSHMVFRGRVRVLKEFVVERGATLEVEPGTVVELYEPIIVEGRLVVKGTKEEPVVFEVNDNYVLCWRSEGVTVEWAVFRGGRGAPLYRDEVSGEVIRNDGGTFLGRFGGALAAYSPTKLLVKNVKFEGGEALSTPLSAGGCFYANGTGVVSYVSAANCRSERGGGLYLSGEFQCDHITVQSCSASLGGGMFFNFAKSRLESSTILKCEARSGGGLFLHSSRLAVRDLDVRECRAKWRGSGICDVLDDGSTFENLFFERNKSRVAVVYLDRSRLEKFAGVEFHKNRCKDGRWVLGFSSALGKGKWVEEDPYRYSYDAVFYAFGGKRDLVPSVGPALVVFVDGGEPSSDALSALRALKDRLESMKFAVVVVKCGELPDVTWINTVKGTPEIKDAYGGVYIYPTFFFIADGKVLFEVAGSKSVEVLEGYAKETEEKSTPPPTEERRRALRRVRGDITD